MGLLSSPLDQTLGSTSKVRLLRLLLEQDRTLSAREAARLIDMSLPAVTAALDSLVKARLVHREISGRQFLCRANRDHLLVMHVLTPLFVSEAKWPITVFGLIREVIAKAARTASESPGHAQFDLIAAWIFGSVAKGTDRPGSDLDLMFLARNEYTSNVLSNEIGLDMHRLSDRVGAEVRPVIVTMQQAKHQLHQNDYFMINAVRNARVVFGEIPSELKVGKAHEHKARR